MFVRHLYYNLAIFNVILWCGDLTKIPN